MSKKNNGKSQSCSKCKFAVHGAKIYRDGRKYKCVVGCEAGHDVMNSKNCAAIVVVQPPRRCAECKVLTSDYEDHKGRDLCRKCIIGIDRIAAPPVMSSNMIEAQDWEQESMWWASFNRELGAAMDKHGIPRNGFRTMNPEKMKPEYKKDKK